VAALAGRKQGAGRAGCKSTGNQGAR